MPSERKREGFVTALGPTSALAETRARSLGRGVALTVEGGAAAARQLLDQGRNRDRLRLGHDGARRDPGRTRAPATTYRRTSRSSASTTRRSWPFLDPALTTVRQPVGQMGGTAVAALADAIGGNPVAAREYLFAPELVLRGSTGPV